MVLVLSYLEKDVQKMKHLTDSKRLRVNSHTSAPSLSSKVNLASGPHISGPQCVICKVTVSGWRITKGY